MKITATKNTESNTYTIDIVMNFTEQIIHTESEGIAASESDLAVEDKEITWYDFIDSIYGKLAIRDFKIKDEHESNRSNSNSYYIVFYPRTSQGELRTEFLIELRISDHTLPKSKNKDKQIRRENYKEGVKKEYMEGNEAPTFEVQSVVVGSKTFSTTANALSYIEYLCNALTNKQSKELSTILKEFLTLGDKK